MPMNHTGRSADLYAENFAPGARVMSGRGDGHDHGSVLSRDVNTYEVAWDNRDATTIDGALLQTEIAEDDCAECRATDDAAIEMCVDEEVRAMGGVASTLDSGRVVIFDRDGGYKVQPPRDNYWVHADTLGEAIRIAEGKQAVPDHPSWQSQ